MNTLTIEQLTDNPDVAPFWRAVQERRFIVQYCAECKKARFGPRLVCAFCGSMQSKWRDDPGLGTVYSMTTVHRAVYDDGPPPPYQVVIAEMDAGITFLARVTASVNVDVGDRVRVTFEDNGSLMLPVFDLIESTEFSPASTPDSEEEAIKNA